MDRDAEKEMERIHRGLEDFLKQELGETEWEQREDTPKEKEPKLFIIEEPRQQEKEIDIIGSPKEKKRGAKIETYYLEDWDRKDNRGRTDNRGRMGEGAGRARTGSSGGSTGHRQENRPGTSAGKSTRSSGGSRPGGNTGVNRGKPADSRERHGRNRRADPDRGHEDIPGNGKKARRPGRQSSKVPEGDNSKKKRSLLSRLKRLLIVAVLIVALLGLGLYQLVGVVYHKMNYSEIPSQTKLPMQEDGVVNILLIGNDSRQNGEDGRSDAMILLSVSRRTRKIYMTSLLRDIYVEIPGHDNNRLNAAYSFGGAELLMDTIGKNFDIPVHRYIQVNFEAFANLLDAVGGVDLELSKEEIEYVNGYLVEYNMLTDRPQGTDNMDPEASGMVHLNGPQALAYCRNRYLGTDFGRTERQRKVMTEVIKKLPGAVVTNFNALTDGLLPNLTTNLTQFECFRLSLMAGRLVTYDLVSDSIPQPGTYKSSTIRKMSVLEVDFEANRRYLKEKIYGER